MSHLFSSLNEIHHKIKELQLVSSDKTTETKTFLESIGFLALCHPFTSKAAYQSSKKSYSDFLAFSSHLSFHKSNSDVVFYDATNYFHSILEIIQVLEVYNSKNFYLPWKSSNHMNYFIFFNILAQQIRSFQETGNHYEALSFEFRVILIVYTTLSIHVPIFVKDVYSLLTSPTTITFSICNVLKPIQYNLQLSTFRLKQLTNIQVSLERLNDFVWKLYFTKHAVSNSFKYILL